MTITDPRGDPSLLQTVVATEHARLQQVLREARKDTSGTPGVHEQLVRNLSDALAAHLNAELGVIHPEVEAVLREAEVEALISDTSALRQLYDREAREWGLDVVSETLERHFQLFDTLLADVRDAIGGKRMATLGFQFGRSAEVASNRLRH